LVIFLSNIGSKAKVNPFSIRKLFISKSDF